MYISHIIIEGFRCFGTGEDQLDLKLRPGLTALVGQNDAGKTAIIDAIRFALGTTDLERNYVEGTDFNSPITPREARICCKFEGLNEADKAAFVEQLSYSENGDNACILYVSWSASDLGRLVNGRSFVNIEVHSGSDGGGPTIAPEVRELLRATYLRPLRDAEDALSAGRGSRLAQILQCMDQVKDKNAPFEDGAELTQDYLKSLSVLGIFDLANHLLERHKGIRLTTEKVDEHLTGLLLQGETSTSAISVSGANLSDILRLRQILEKLDISLGGTGKPGLGSNNVLFMACELLLLAQIVEGNKLLLIEEPEAHLHPQRQLRVMQWLQARAEADGIQVIVTTHSPNLASAIRVEGMVLLHQHHAFPMSADDTMLEKSDYEFLQRFLDVTKANLFFARGVLIVEGDAENILIPTLASLMGRDLTEHGVSIVNVGGIGLRRYARIFQRKGSPSSRPLDIPIACITDMDVMPDCAPVILKLTSNDGTWTEARDRKWRASKDIGDIAALAALRKAKEGIASGQSVRTWVSDKWTFEYDLALGPKNKSGGRDSKLARHAYIAAHLAHKDDAINDGKTTAAAETQIARESYKAIVAAAEAEATLMSCTPQELVACKTYAIYVKGQTSKSIGAQYLANSLSQLQDGGKITAEEWRAIFPDYLINAIEYVTGGPPDSNGPKD